MLARWGYAAARFVRERADQLAADDVPATATQHAVLAVRLHGAFLRGDEATGCFTPVEPEPETVRIELAREAGPGRRVRPGM